MSWNGWASLGGALAGGRPAAAQNTDGRLELFAALAGAQGPELGHVWQTGPNGGWSAWESLGVPPAQFLGVVAPGRNADGRLEVFARVGLMSTGVLWHTWQTTPGGAWSGWDSLGGSIGPQSLAARPNQDGRQEVFAVSNDGTLQHVWQTSPNGGWSTWDDLGSPPGLSLTAGLAAAQNQDGRLEVFAVAVDGTLWHLWQQAPNGGWSPWASLGAPASLTLSEPDAARNQDGRLELFAIGQDALWHSWQDTTGGSWAAWASLGTPSGVANLASPSVATNADGRLEAFAFDVGGGVWHVWQTSAGASWSTWDSLGGQPNAGLAVGTDADGRLEVFAEDGSGSHGTWHRWQVSPGGGWSSAAEEWQPLGPVEAVTALAVDATGVVLAAGSSGVWKSTDHGGSWNKVSSTLIAASLSFRPAGGSVWGVSADGKQLLESADGGATWSARYTGGDETQLNFVLATTGAIWAGMSAADTLAEVIRSTDGGASWTPTLPASLRGGGGLSPTTAGPLTAAGSLLLAGARYYHSGGVLKTADGGATWTLAYNDSLTPLAGASALAAAGSTVYAGLNVLQSGSLVRSDDGGGTWSNLSSELPIHGSGSGGVVANLVLDPSQPDSVYTSMWDTGSPQRTGVFVSADRGQTWTEIGHLAAQVAGPGGLALDAAARRLYAATGTGVYAWDVPA